MLIDSLNQGTVSQLWYFNGAASTLRSYGGLLKIPDDHLDFFHSTRYYYVIEDKFFVHAGVKPKIPLEKQKIEDLLWIREEFILSQDPLPGFKVIFGHTPFEEPLILKDKIGIDTGCVYSGKLSCFCVESGGIFQVICRG